MQLCEECRPKTWAEVVGQEKALSKIEGLRARGLGGRAYWISGATGTGKTTIARLLAAEVADEWGVEEIDASEVTAEACESWRRNLRCRLIGEKGGRAIVVNEAHGLRREACRRLLTILEDLPPHVIFVFTLTSEGQELLFDGVDDSSPLVGRCTEIPLARRGLAEPFAARAQAVAQANGLDGKPMADYLRLAKDCGNSLRRMLQQIEAGKMKD